MKRLATLAALLATVWITKGQSAKSLVRSYATPAAMCSNTPTASEYFAVVGRYTNNNDGFIAYFTPGATNVANGYSVFMPTNAASGRWFRIAMPGTLLEGGASGIDIQVFTNAGAYTWTKPSGALVSYVMAVGGGGGGWGGAVANIDDSMTFLDMFSGEGGAGGGWSERYLYAAELPSTVSVHVGAGGTGGAGSTVSAQAGVNGDPATDSWFGASVETNYVFAGSAGSYYDSPGTGQFPGGSGVVGSHDYGYVTANASGTGKQATGGGAGGSLANDLITGTGEGSGAYSAPAYNSRFTGRATWSQNGTNGLSFGLFGTGQGGGGGGGANIDIMLATNAGHGGNGGWPGGGGGGGGLGIANVGGKLGNGGNGGDGADGFVGIITLLSSGGGGGSGGGITDLIGAGTASGPGIAALSLTATGVTNGVYGSAAYVPQFSVNTAGQITGATNRAVNNFYSTDGSFLTARYVDGNVTNDLVFQNMSNFVAGAQSMYLFSGNTTLSGNNLILFGYDAYMNIGSAYSNLLSTNYVNVLTVDPLTARVDFQPLYLTAQNIYTTNGTLAGNRVVDGDTYSLAITNTSDLYLSSTAELLLDAGLGDFFLRTAGVNAESAQDGQLLQLRYASNGLVEFTYLTNALSETSVSNFVVGMITEHAPSVNIYNSDGTLTGNRNVTGDSYNLSFTDFENFSFDVNGNFDISSDGGEIKIQALDSDVTIDGFDGVTLSVRDSTVDNPFIKATWQAITLDTKNADSIDGGLYLKTRAVNNGSATVGQVLVLTNLSGQVEFQTISPGTTINATTGKLPYRSSSTAFSDSPITRVDADTVKVGTAANIATSGGGHALVYGGTSADLFLGANNNGSGDFVVQSVGFSPTTDGTKDIGAVSTQVNNLYIKGAVKFNGGTIIDAYGSGSPEGVVTGSVGSTYRRTDGGAGTSFYVKESGSGNTGWVGK